MSRVQEVSPRVTVRNTPSYFWSCFTLADDCPFFSAVDPKLYYFGVGLLGFYAAFLIVILADFKFYWSLDNFQNQIDYYINLVKKKVRSVQRDQKRLSTIQERTEKQLTRSKGCNRVVVALRRALTADDPQQLDILTKNYSDPNPTNGSDCNINSSLLEF